MATYSQTPAGVIVQPKPFKVSIPQPKIDDFQTLLRLSKIAPPTYENLQEDRRYGITARWLSEAKEEWLNNFNWRHCEDKINSFPNFITPVSLSEGEDYDIHFVALFSQKADAIPIILTHGWPGSFLEFLPILSLMREQYTPETLPYHLIVPSVPGYAFSAPPPLDKDFDTEIVAQLLNQLMLNLGFGSGYVAQGGDIGAKVSRILGVKYESCKAVHLNFCMVPEPKGFDPKSLDEVELKGLRRGEDWMKKGTAYALEHATKPSTIGLILASNPLALLSWIGEKFLDWTDEDPPLSTILESVSLYWFTETFPRSIYPYRERFSETSPAPHIPAWRINKPFGYSWFSHELNPIPRSWIEPTGDLVLYRQHLKGGHFAALEQPELLKGDLEAFVQQVWKK